ncbi:MAG TPA: cation:proton antiporter, partial [Chromatiales bacterium]|nr:cation:proton antiporter [Chromatiales bacterium]
MEPLVQLAIMWCGVFIASVLADKTKLTSVLYFLAFGTVMVNTGFLPTETSPFIRGFADIGIILIMFALGFEENTRNFLRSIRRSWSIAFFGGAAPFLVAYLVADWFWNDRSIAIMSGLTMTATAVSLTMVSLRNLGLQTSRAAMGIMTSAVLDDIASLALVAVLVPIATGASVVSVPAIAWIIGKAVLFFIGIAVLGAYLLPHDLKGWIARVPLIGRYGLRDLLAAGQGEHSTLTVLLIALVIGLVAHALGFHPAVGAYMAGLIL